MAHELEIFAEACIDEVKLLNPEIDIYVHSCGYIDAHNYFDIELTISEKSSALRYSNHAIRYQLGFFCVQIDTTTPYDQIENWINKIVADFNLKEPAGTTPFSILVSFP